MPGGGKEDNHTRQAYVLCRLCPKPSWHFKGSALVLAHTSDHCPRPGTGRCLMAFQVPRKAGSPLPGGMPLTLGQADCPAFTERRVTVDCVWGCVCSGSQRHPEQSSCAERKCAITAAASSPHGRVACLSWGLKDLLTRAMCSARQSRFLFFRPLRHPAHRFHRLALGQHLLAVGHWCRAHDVEGEHAGSDARLVGGHQCDVCLGPSRSKAPRHPCRQGRSPLQSGRLCLEPCCLKSLQACGKPIASPSHQHRSNFISAGQGEPAHALPICDDVRLRQSTLSLSDPAGQRGLLFTGPSCVCKRGLPSAAVGMPGLPLQRWSALGVMQVAMEACVKPTGPPPELAAGAGLPLQRCLGRSKHGSLAGSHADMGQAYCRGAWPSQTLQSCITRQ